MDIFYRLEQQMKRPTSHQEEQPVQEEKKTKWEKKKDIAKDVLGFLGVVIPAIVLFSAPWWLQELFGEETFHNSVVIAFVIVAVFVLVILFYGVWRLVNKNMANSKSKAKIIITSIVIYVLIVALLVGFIYICGLIAPTDGVNDGHLHRL